MVTKELVAYIRDQLQLSVGEIIRENLRVHGWKEEDIDDAFRQALLETPYTAAPVPKKKWFRKKLFLIIIFLLFLLLVPIAFGIYSYYFTADSPIHTFFKQPQTVDDQKPISTPTKAEPTPTAPEEGFSDISARVRDNQRKVDLSKIASALETYMTENNTYPALLTDLVPKQLDELPKDPQTQKDYEYSLKDNGQDYELCAVFESTGRQCVSSKTRVSDL